MPVHEGQQRAVTCLMDLSFEWLLTRILLVLLGNIFNLSIDR
jgi:hypothetical protein